MSPGNEIPLRSLHDALGALFAASGEGEQVASYGRPGDEYRAARDHAALVHLHERAVLEASGPQRQKFLQGMLSNEVAGLQPGQGCAAAFLSPKGGVLALVRVLVEPAAVALETASDRVAPLQRSLEHYRVAAPVRFAPRADAVFAVIGPHAGDVLAAAGAELPATAAESHVATRVAGQPVHVARAGDLPRPGFVIHAPAAAAAVFQALHFAGGRLLGHQALDALRVEALRPWYGSDVDEANLLHETGLLRERHSPAKGCYVGQEVVARLEGRGGHVNKGLRGLRLEQPAATGAPVTADGQEVGRVTTAAVSPRLGPIAMGYVHRSHFAPGTRVLVDGAPAVVVDGFEE
jgi:folate-binding protein YgfZ